MKKEYKSSIIKDHKITKKKKKKRRCFRKRLRSFLSYFLDFTPKIENKHCGNIQ